MRKGFKFCDGRAVYECVNSPERSLWYAAPYWYVGPTKDLGKAQGWLCCKDDAPCPEHVRASWHVGVGHEMLTLTINLTLTLTLTLTPTPTLTLTPT